MITTVYMLLAIMIAPDGDFKYSVAFTREEAQCKMMLAVRKSQMEQMKPFWSKSACVPIRAEFPKNPESKT